MGRYTLHLDSIANRERAIDLIKKSPPGTFLTFKRNKRTVDQNSRMWAMLSRISSECEWHGMKYSADDWKDFFSHALSRARWMPDENGGLIPLSLKTSMMSKQEHSDLTTLVEEFAARHGILLGDEDAPNSRSNKPHLRNGEAGEASAPASPAHNSHTESEHD